jgi:hypothetical protein
MHFLILFAACMLLVIYPLEASEIWMNFGVEGTGTFVPRPAPKYDKTYTGVSSREVEPEYEPEFPIWLLTEDNTTPCLEGPPGCLLGTFTFQPPRIDLPAGTKARNANFMWGAPSTFP